MPSKLDVLAAGEILFGLLDAGIVALAGEIADEVAQLKERYRYECNGYCRVSPCIGDPECGRQTESGLDVYKRQPHRPLAGYRHISAKNSEM